MHTNKLPCYSMPSFLPTYHLPILVSSDYKIWGDWVLLFEMAQAVLDSGFITCWQLQRWSISPHLDRRKYLTSCPALAGWAAAVQCGPFASTRGTSDYLSCVSYSNSCSASSGSVKKSHRPGSVPQAEPWCAAWHDTDSLAEHRSHWALCDLT